MNTALSEMLAWRIVALVFAAMLVAGSAGACWVMIRDGQRIAELERRLSCWESSRTRAPAPLLTPPSTP